MTTAEAYVPERAGLRALAAAAAGCQGCELYQNATQTVFGAGPAHARVMFVGEQPGDVEDKRGEPFVGPAGKLLDRAFGDAGIDRQAAYLTNAVKHFRWKSTSTGKRRIHDKPDARHIHACQPWLSAELATVRPGLVVALGAVAAQALFGSAFRLTRHRGELLDWPPPAGPYTGDELPIRHAAATVHPSSVLRARDADARAAAYAAFVEDLRSVAAAL